MKLGLGAKKKTPKPQPFTLRVEDLLGEQLGSDDRLRCDEKIAPVYDLDAAKVAALCSYIDVHGKGVRIVFSPLSLGVKEQAEVLFFAMTLLREDGRARFNLVKRVDQNPLVAARLLVLYLTRAKETLLPFSAYAKIPASANCFSTSNADAIPLAESIITAIGHPRIDMLQRILRTLIFWAAGDTTLVQAACEYMADSIFAPPVFAVEPKSQDLMQLSKTQLLQLLMTHGNRGLYAAPLTEEEWAILQAGAKRQTMDSGSTILKEGQRNTGLWRISWGTVSVRVGNVTIAHLGLLDVFGELSVLGNSYSRASVVAESDVSVVFVEASSLDAVFALRPGLGWRFWLLQACETARRLNLTMMRGHSARAEQEEGDDAPPPPAQPNLPQGEFTEQSSVVAFRTHSGSNKRDTKTLFLFPGLLQVSQVKWGRHKEKIVHWREVESISQNQTAVSLRLLAGKPLVFSFDKVETAYEFTLACTTLHSVAQHGKLEKDFIINTGQGTAFLDFVPTQAGQITLAAGETVVILEREKRSGWHFGFAVDAPEKKGFFPANHVELSVGLGLPGMPTKADWSQVFETASAVDFGPGSVLLREGDKEASGSVIVIQGSSAQVFKRGPDNKLIRLCAVAQGEVIGEISFLLGGAPRASVVVPLSSPQGCKALVLPHKKLRTLIEADEALGCRFLKFLAASMARRLASAQAIPSSVIGVPFASHE